LSPDRTRAVVSPSIDGSKEAFRLMNRTTEREAEVYLRQRMMEAGVRGIRVVLRYSRGQASVAGYCRLRDGFASVRVARHAVYPRAYPVIVATELRPDLREGRAWWNVAVELVILRSVADALIFVAAHEIAHWVSGPNQETANRAALSWLEDWQCQDGFVGRPSAGPEWVAGSREFPRSSGHWEARGDGDKD